MGTGGRGHRPRLRAAADDDHLLFELHRQDGVQGNPGPGSDRHAAARFRAEAGQRERDVVSAGRESGERERPGAVGDGDGHRAAGLCGGLDGHAGQHEARGVGDRAFDGRVLGMDDARRGKPRQQGESDAPRQPVQATHSGHCFARDGRESPSPFGGRVRTTILVMCFARVAASPAPPDRSEPQPSGASSAASRASAATASAAPPVASRQGCGRPLPCPLRRA